MSQIVHDENGSSTSLSSDASDFCFDVPDDSEQFRMNLRAEVHTHRPPCQLELDDDNIQMINALNSSSQGQGQTGFRYFPGFCSPVSEPVDLPMPFPESFESLDSVRPDAYENSMNNTHSQQQAMFSSISIVCPQSPYLVQQAFDETGTLGPLDHSPVEQVLFNDPSSAPKVSSSQNFGDTMNFNFDILAEAAKRAEMARLVDDFDEVLL